MQAGQGQEKLSMSNKRKVTTGLISNNQSLLKVTTPNKRAAQVGFSPKSHGVPQLSACRRMEENHSKSPQSCVSSEKAQVEYSMSKSQPVDANAGAFDSVRAKLRESLTAALAFVSQHTASSMDLKKKSEDKATMTTLKGESKSLESSSSTAQTSNIESVTESCRSGGPYPSNKCSYVESSSQEVPFNNMPEEASRAWKFVGQEFQAYPGLPGDDAPFSNGFFFKDELLQGNGLSWALELDTQIPEVQEVESTEKDELAHFQKSEDTKELVNQSPGSVAFKIESELFKFFGGVNKKYKEKGRSLLFNLKDRNNPELRERVMSGEISPERLCAMTAEELASKELSQWRMAKAEELDQMKVLPDSEVDVRRLVKKTHKGEYQVEFDQDVTVVEDVSHNTSVVPEMKGASDARLRRKADEAKEHKAGQCRITIPGDGADMQGLMVDDVRDLPPIVSLDEFMESLDKEPPFEIMPVDPGTTIPVSDQKSPKVHAEPNSPAQPSKVSVDSILQNKEVAAESVKRDDDIMSTESRRGLDMNNMGLFTSPLVHAEPNSPAQPSKVCAESILQNKEVAAESVKRDDGIMSTESRRGSDTINMGLFPSPQVHAEPNSSAQPSKVSAESILQNKEVAAESVKRDDDIMSTESLRGSDTINMGCLPNIKHFWEGLLQINVSSMAPVFAIYKSGEKPSTKEWPDFFEIKGRVRLDPFDKFLQELPMSRSRAIMVAHFVLKDGCTVSERANLVELIDSYMADQRLGYAEPTPGVELYLCAPNSRPVDLVVKHLPQEYTEKINDIGIGVIGILVWRKERVTNAVPPNSSQHKLATKGQPLTFGRQHHDKDVIHTNVSFASGAVLPPSLTNPTSNDDEDDDDVPPGFGPPGGTQEDDDLPEFNFIGGANPWGSRMSYPNPSSGQEMDTCHLRPGAPSPQMKQLRELIQKYGHGDGASAGNGIPLQPWKNDDDDDDMPEWEPQHVSHTHKQLRPQPPLPPPSHQTQNPMLIPRVNRPFLQTPLVPWAKPMQPLQPPMMGHGAWSASSANSMSSSGIVGGQHTGCHFHGPPVTGHLSRDQRPPNAAPGRSGGF